MNNHTLLLAQLPQELWSLQIAQGHKVLLHHQKVGGDMWVVLLTDMPDQQDRAWRMTTGEYWGIETLHESRDRWVRGRFAPTYTGGTNPPKQVAKVLSLF